MKIHAPKYCRILSVTFSIVLLLPSSTLLADVFSEVPTVQICNKGNKEFSVASISNDKYWKYGSPEKFELRGWHVVEPGIFSNCIYAAGHGGGGVSYYVFAIDGNQGKRIINVTVGDNWRGFTDSGQRFCINPTVDRLRRGSETENLYGKRSEFADPDICANLGPGWVLGPPSVALGTSGSTRYKLTLDPDDWPAVEVKAGNVIPNAEPEQQMYIKKNGAVCAAQDQAHVLWKAWFTDDFDTINEILRRKWCVVIDVETRVTMVRRDNGYLIVRFLDGSQHWTFTAMIVYR